MADNQIQIGVEVISDAAKKIDAIAKSTEGLEKAVEKLGGKSRIFDNFVGSLAASGVTKALSGMADAASAAFRILITEGVAAASKDADAFNALSVALAQSGQSAGGAANKFRSFAEEIQKTTKFGSDQIVNAGALLSQLTGLSEAGLERATKAAANLSSAIGIDLDTASRVVAKSINGSTEALSKYGIKVQAGADQNQNFANTMDALGKFSGSAEAQLNTFSGATSFAGNAFEEVQKVFGELIVQNPAIIGAFRAIGTIFVDLANDLKANSQGISEFFAQATAVLIDYVSSGLKAFDGLVKFFKGNEADTFLQKYITTLDSAKTKAIETSASIAMGTTEITVGYESAANSAKKLTEEQQKQVDAGKQLALAAQSGQGIDSTLEMKKAQHEAELISDEEFLTAQDQAIQAHLQIQQQQLLAAKQQGAITEEQFRLANVESQKKADAQLLTAQTQFNQKRAQNMASTLSTISTLQQNATGDLFRVGQAAAVATATIDGIAAVQKALASAPPPFNFALAGLVGVATAANIAKIASASPPKLATGIDSVPGIGTRDNFPAILAPGERVVPASTNVDLKSFLADSGGLRAVMEGISAKLDRLQNNTVVQIGERVIANEVRSAIQSGRVVLA